MNSEFTSDTLNCSTVSDNVVTISITCEGVVQDDSARFREIMKSCGFYDDNTDGNLFAALIQKADEHNPFAAKILEGVEAVIMGEYDRFEIICPDIDSLSEKMRILAFSPAKNGSGLILDIFDESIV